MEGRQPFAGRSVWTGPELEASSDWIYLLDESHLSEIDAGVAATRGRPYSEIRRDDFPLKRTAAVLEALADELENGRGIARLKSLPVERYGEEELQRIYWAILLHLGRPLYQSPKGDLFRAIRDVGSGAEIGPAGTMKSARAKTLSTDSLNFHTDNADVVCLLCVANAREGGLSKVASTARIYNEMLVRRPDLLEVLLRDFHHHHPEQVPGKVMEMPVFGVRDGRLTSVFAPANLRKAHEIMGTPPLDAAQEEALRLLQALGDELCLHMAFAPGDIQFLNNHFVCHGRTDFADGAEAGSRRYMMRAWLSMPSSRALPPAFGALWGEVAAGALRGGAALEELGRSPAA